MNQNGNQIESRLWDAADELRANSKLKLPEAARFSYLIQLPEGANIGQAINDAMRTVEGDNPDLKDVLPKTYNRFENATLAELLRIMSSIPMDIEGDAFGKIYEYFLGHFAMSEEAEGRRVLHAHRYSQAHRLHHGAFPGAHL